MVPWLASLVGVMLRVSGGNKYYWVEVGKVGGGHTRTRKQGVREKERKKKERLEQKKEKRKKERRGRGGGRWWWGREGGRGRGQASSRLLITPNTILLF